MYKCDQDCFNCPFPDCTLSYKEAGSLTDEIAPFRIDETHNRRDPNSEKSARQKAYYAANVPLHREKGLALRRYRKSQGIKQSAMARGIGVSQSTLSMWESGKIPIDTKRVAAVYPDIKEAIT